MGQSVSRLLSGTESQPDEADAPVARAATLERRASCETERPGSSHPDNDTPTPAGPLHYTVTVRFFGGIVGAHDMLSHGLFGAARDGTALRARVPDTILGRIKLDATCSMSMSDVRRHSLTPIRGSCLRGARGTGDLIDAKTDNDEVGAGGDGDSDSGSGSDDGASVQMILFKNTTFRLPQVLPMLASQQSRIVPHPRRISRVQIGILLPWDRRTVDEIRQGMMETMSGTETEQCTAMGLQGRGQQSANDKQWERLIAVVNEESEPLLPGGYADDTNVHEMDADPVRRYDCPPSNQPKVTTVEIDNLAHETDAAVVMDVDLRDAASVRAMFATAAQLALATVASESAPLVKSAAKRM